ncbi:hypothetical protein H0H93_008045 [Arthromyces matolae]|nr:hypothetical protein H0H93_008045 [Arthromyces matolae]
MATFQLLSLFLLTLYASLINAAPWPTHARHATHQVRHIGRSNSLSVKTFHPKSTFKTFGASGIDSPVPDNFKSNLLVAPSINDSAVAFVQSHLNVNASQVGYHSGFSGGVNQKYAYVKQYHVCDRPEGIPFSNAVANVAWKDGKVVAFGSSFVSISTIASSTPSLTVESVIPTVEDALEGSYNNHPTSLEYLVRDDESVALTHVVQVRNETSGTWYEAFVCAHSGNILSVTDFVSHASYHVVPIHKETFTEGEETLVDPQDPSASPFGWHSDGTSNSTNTSGNNVAAFVARSLTNQTSDGLVFDPRRDGAMENDIVVHELTHGVTNRMTGGGSGRCLQTIEAGGLGEGWSDAMADWVHHTSGDVEDFVLGQFVTKNTAGIRTHPYSTDSNVNPLRYSNLAKLNEVHLIGEVWANMLHNVYAALVSDRGFSNEALTNPDTTEGNVVFMHLFLDALLLQPCNPTFVSARDAWIQADENRYNGANKCTLFNAFASRGLGLNADTDFVDNTDVPDGC